MDMEMNPIQRHKQRIGNVIHQSIASAAAIKSYHK